MDFKWSIMAINEKIKKTVDEQVEFITKSSRNAKSPDNKRRMREYSDALMEMEKERNYLKELRERL